MLAEDTLYFNENLQSKIELNEFLENAGMHIVDEDSFVLKRECDLHLFRKNLNEVFRTRKINDKMAIDLLGTFYELAYLSKGYYPYTEYFNFWDFKSKIRVLEKIRRNQFKFAENG